MRQLKLTGFALTCLGATACTAGFGSDNELMGGLGVVVLLFGLAVFVAGRLKQ